MRLEDTDVATLAKAVDVYLEIAWGEAAAEKSAALGMSSAVSIGDALDRFTDERRVGKLRKYTLRLGHAKYPNMKLVFQELLVRDKFFFAVDAHDEVFVDQTWQDFEHWIELKRQNSEIKEKVEQAWAAAGLPTFASVVSEIEQETRQNDGPTGHGDLILIVDDDAGIAAGVEIILKQQGYRTIKARGATEAEKILEDVRPALVLSDLEMPPGPSGLDLARKVRANPAMAGVPFILATAASIDASHFSLIDGYLVKPFETSVLLKFIARNLSRSQPR
jgi:CheY-like chemotaxis protein